MKLALIIALVAAGALVAGVAAKQRKPPGRCQPYAETCAHCTDCSTCGHCSISHGQCSICAGR